MSGGPQEAAQIVSMAGGKIVGSTRLQKIGCLLELTGADFGFKFFYHRYGPYSEVLSIAAADAGALRLIKVAECRADWGGHYRVYEGAGSRTDAPDALLKIAHTAAKADSVELELAVTAAYLATEGSKQPWEEVALLKSGKATPERIAGAKNLYQTFTGLRPPKPLPAI